MARNLALRSIFSLIVFLYLFSFPHPFLADSHHSSIDLPNIYSLRCLSEAIQFQQTLSENSTQTDFINEPCLDAQNIFADSIYIGRKCKVVLFNGFEAVGRIVYLTKDSLRIKTDTYEHKILVKDIKYVMDKDEDVGERDDMGNQIEKIRIEDPDHRIESEECDLLLANRIELKNVSLLIYNDSTIYAYTDNYRKDIKFSDIRKIVFKGSSGFGTGFLIGAAVGFSIGFFPLAFTRADGHPGFGGPAVGAIVGLIFTLPGAIVGGLLGLAFDKDDIYHFENGNTANKQSWIKYVIMKHQKDGGKTL